MYIPGVALETIASGEHTFLQAVLDPSALPKRGVDPFRQERGFWDRPSLDARAFAEPCSEKRRGSRRSLKHLNPATLNPEALNS